MASLQNTNNNNNPQQNRKQGYQSQQNAQNFQQRQQQRGRKRGPAPQSYVFDDINNYEDEEAKQWLMDQQQHQQLYQNNGNGRGVLDCDNREERNIIEQIEYIQRERGNGINDQNFASPDDTDFNSSCCDYQSDIFKEQPSEYIDEFNSNKFVCGQDHPPNYNDLKNFGHLGSAHVMSLQECGSETDFKENLIGSAYGGSIAGARSIVASGGYPSLSPNSTVPKLNTNAHQHITTSTTTRSNGHLQQQQAESKSSLQIILTNSNSGNQNVLSLQTQSERQRSAGQALIQGAQSQQNTTTKNSCDQSLITPNYRTQNNGVQTSTNKHSKQPFYSMVPHSINKNLNNQAFSSNESQPQQQLSSQPSTQKQEQQQIIKSNVYSYNSNKPIKTGPQLYIGQHNQDESVDCVIMSGQMTVQKGDQHNQSLGHGGSPYQNLTPQKNLPQPISPQIKPSMSNLSRQDGCGGAVSVSGSHSSKPQSRIMSINYQLNSQQHQQMLGQQYDSRNFNQQVPQSAKTQNSGQKTTSVVYNEFKYYTSGAEVQNTSNPKKYINISGLTNQQQYQQLKHQQQLQQQHPQTQRKSDTSASHIQNNNPNSNNQNLVGSLQYELSPNNQQQCIFDMSSPKQSISNGQASFSQAGGNTGTFVRANSVRKQIYNTDRHHLHHNQQPIIPQVMNYQLQLKNENLGNEESSPYMQNQINPDSELTSHKIKQLQEYIEQLEHDLYQSQNKNQELKKKFKERSFIQSFERQSSQTNNNKNANINKKHLSDTEDSLILSEKKGNKKNSIQSATNHNVNTRGSLQVQQRENNSITNGGGYTFAANNNSASNKGGSNCQLFSQAANDHSGSNQQHMLFQLSNQNTNSRTNSHDLLSQQQQQLVQQKSSSILDVKIRPIVNMKGMQVNSGQITGGKRELSSPRRLNKNSSANQLKDQQDTHQNQRRFNEQQQDSQNILEYQVQDFNDQSNSNCHLNNSAENNRGQNYCQNNEDAQEPNQEIDLSNASQANNQQHQQHCISEDDCEGCERLKQLVFQAKEAIDDLKLEIDEWRDICSQKETELRQLQHKIYNDIVGVDKKTEFNEEVQTKEFDQEKPVSAGEAKRIRNFIQHNKNRIRSRSKNSQLKNSSDANINQVKKINSGSISNAALLGSTNGMQSLRKRSALKNVRELASEDFEFYEAEDIAIQTSFEQGQPLHELQTNVSTDDRQINHEGGFMTSKKQSMQQVSGLTSQYQSVRKPIISSLQGPTQTSPDRVQTFNTIQDENNNNISSQALTQQYVEEVCSLRTKNQMQEQEMQKMKVQISAMTGQIEKFVGLIQKTKKRNNLKRQQVQVDIEDIKATHEIISNIESYSILEKINEWKREEGLIDTNSPDQEPLPTQIPRPMKLIQDIDLAELDLIDPSLALQHSKKLNDNSSMVLNPNTLHLNTSTNTNLTHHHQQHNNHNQSTSLVGGSNWNNSKQHNNNMENNAQELLQMIKQEQENIKRQTDQKYKELHKQQQDYLNVLKGV